MNQLIMRENFRQVFKKIWRAVFFYLLFFSVYKTYSQSKLIDKDTDIPIAGVLIYSTDNKVLDITNERGVFKVDDDSIRIKNILYGDTIVKVSKKIYLKRKVYTLREVQVKDTIPIMLRLKNAFLNSMKALPSDTVLYYKFEINTGIKELNWHEKATGVFRVEIDKKNNVNVYICDGYSYGEDSIDWQIYFKILTFRIKSVFNIYQKDTKQFKKYYKKLLRKIKKKKYYFTWFFGGDNYKIKLFDYRDTTKFTFNNYIDSILFFYQRSKVLNIKKPIFISTSNYMLIDRWFYLNSIELQGHYEISMKDKIYKVTYTYSTMLTKQNGCRKFFEFNDGYHLDFLFKKIEKQKN